MGIGDFLFVIVAGMTWKYEYYGFGTDSDNDANIAIGMVSIIGLVLVVEVIFTYWQSLWETGWDFILSIVGLVYYIKRKTSNVDAQ